MTFQPSLVLSCPVHHQTNSGPFKFSSTPVKRQTARAPKAFYSIDLPLPIFFTHTHSLTHLYSLSPITLLSLPTLHHPLTIFAHPATHRILSLDLPSTFPSTPLHATRLGLHRRLHALSASSLADKLPQHPIPPHTHTPHYTSTCL